jgi:hypothetical protein
MLLTVFDLIGDLTAVMRLVNSVYARSILWQLVSFAEQQRNIANDPMIYALRDSLGCKISLDEDFEGVSAIFLLNYLVDPILECLKGPKIIEDPLPDPIWSFGVIGGQAGSLSEGRTARRL